MYFRRSINLIPKPFVWSNLTPKLYKSVEQVHLLVVPVNFD